MKTLVVSTFPACGKTYLSDEQKKLEYSVLDADSNKFKNTCFWESKYIEYIQNNLNKYDFILICQHDNVLTELDNKNISYVTVAPNNSDAISLKERNLIKQQWFGRFLLRDNSHIKNMRNWLQKIYTNYDIWTKPDFFKKFKTIRHFTLNQNQYLLDIIDELYYFKENI